MAWEGVAPGKWETRLYITRQALHSSHPKRMGVHQLKLSHAARQMRDGSPVLQLCPKRHRLPAMEHVIPWKAKTPN